MEWRSSSMHGRQAHELAQSRHAIGSANIHAVHRRASRPHPKQPPGVRHVRIACALASAHLSELVRYFLSSSRCYGSRSMPNARTCRRQRQTRSIARPLIDRERGRLGCHGAVSTWWRRKPARDAACEMLMLAYTTVARRSTLRFLALAPPGRRDAGPAVLISPRRPRKSRSSWVGRQGKTKPDDAYD